MRRETRDEILRGFLAINAMLREETRDVRKALAARRTEAKYNPHWPLQPRAPRGTTEGGRWVVEGSGPKSPEHNSPKQPRPQRKDPEHREQRPAAFFDSIEDNPYLWVLSEKGLLPSQPTVADFYNLHFEMLDLRAIEFSDVARSVDMRPSELMNALRYGSSVMSERAINAIDGLLADPGPGGLSIVIREERFREYIEHLDVRPEYRERMFNEILDLAGYTPSEFEQRKLDVGVGSQFSFLIGGGGPAATPGIIPRASARLRNPNYVWNLGQVTRGRVIEAALGHNLPANFRIIDRFGDDGVATSIKSLDLRAATYHRPQTLERRLKGFVDQVAGFRGATYAGRTIRAVEITGRALDLVVPHAGTASQQQVINAIVRYGRSRGVTVNVIIYP
jgi:hypothetical protein